MVCVQNVIPTRPILVLSQHHSVLMLMDALFVAAVGLMLIVLTPGVQNVSMGNVLPVTPSTMQVVTNSNHSARRVNLEIGVLTVSSMNTAMIRVVDFVMVANAKPVRLGRTPGAMTLTVPSV